MFYEGELIKLVFFPIRPRSLKTISSPQTVPSLNSKVSDGLNFIEGTRCLGSVMEVGRVGLCKAFVTICYKIHMTRKIF